MRATCPVHIILLDLIILIVLGGVSTEIRTEYLYNKRLEY
jgi:hypothetical protein